jgi:hypothetical protein
MDKMTAAGPAALVGNIVSVRRTAGSSGANRLTQLVRGTFVGMVLPALSTTKQSSTCTLRRSRSAQKERGPFDAELENAYSRQVRHRAGCWVLAGLCAASTPPSHHPYSVRMHQCGPRTLNVEWVCCSISGLFFLPLASISEHWCYSENAVGACGKRHKRKK